MLTLNDGRAELWQWDTGRTLAVDADCSQVHFSNKVFGRSIDVDVVDGVAIIPDVLLQTDNDLNIWAFAGTAENGYTKISKTFTVNRRNKPADYVFTPADQMTLHTIQSQIGDLSDLTTEAKDTLVAAINEAAQSGGSTVELDTTLTQSGKAADAKAVGDRLSVLSDEIANLSSGGAGLTTAQINALDGMFKVAAYTEDVSGAYAAFKTAFGLVDTGVTTYTITAELVNVTSSNNATSVSEGASYTATLTAADGYEIDSVSVLMGGVDVTADVYANGVISIASVTGNVEIAASAIESGVTEALNTNGLVFNYDFRNSAMELYNLSGWGNVYRTVDKTGNSLIFGTTEATGDGKGLKDYGFRDNRLISSETEKVKLGETYTAQALFRANDKRVQPNLFGWGVNAVGVNRFKISPKYLVGTTETSTAEVLYSREDTQYIVITYVVSGKSLTVYHNTDLVLTLDGNNYDNFTKWMDYGIPNSVYSEGYITAFVGYNRALTQSEIMDNIAFFKTLEVA